MTATTKHSSNSRYSPSMLKTMPWLATMSPSHHKHFPKDVVKTNRTVIIASDKQAHSDSSKLDNTGPMRIDSDSVTITSGAIVTVRKPKAVTKTSSRKRLGKISLFAFRKFGVRAVPELRFLKSRES